jgi:hypothetical protein
MNLVVRCFKNSNESSGALFEKQQWTVWCANGPFGALFEKQQ